MDVNGKLRIGDPLAGTSYGSRHVYIYIFIYLFICLFIYLNIFINKYIYIYHSQNYYQLRFLDP